MLTRALALAALIAGSLLLATLLARRNGRARAVRSDDRLTADDLGSPLGTTATFVQFSSRTCAPCRTVRRTLADVTAARPDLVHVEVDAESRLDLVRRYQVLATPTVLVLDAAGIPRQRLRGTPHPVQLRLALATVAPEPSPHEETR